MIDVSTYHRRYKVHSPQREKEFIQLPGRRLVGLRISEIGTLETLFPTGGFSMGNFKCDLTAERVRDLLHYDLETGIFTWRFSRRGCSKGVVQGTFDPDGYQKIGVDRKCYMAHRLAWFYVYGVWPHNQIDHINGVRTDNRILNLRDVPPRINAENRHSAMPNSSSGILGASWKEKRKSYHVAIRAKGKHYFLGLFKDPEQAREAYVTAKRKLHEGNTL